MNSIKADIKMQSSTRLLILFFYLTAYLFQSCVSGGGSTQVDDINQGQAKFFQEKSYQGGFTLFAISGETTKLSFKLSLGDNRPTLSLYTADGKKEVLKFTASNQTYVQAQWLDPSFRNGSNYLENAGRAIYELAALKKNEVDEKWNTTVNVAGEKADVHIADFSGKYSIQISHKDFLASLQFEEIP